MKAQALQPLALVLLWALGMPSSATHERCAPREPKDDVTQSAQLPQNLEKSIRAMPRETPKEEKVIYDRDSPFPPPQGTSRNPPSAPQIVHTPLLERLWIFTYVTALYVSIIALICLPITMVIFYFNYRRRSRDRSSPTEWDGRKELWLRVNIVTLFSACTLLIVATLMPVVFGPIADLIVQGTGVGAAELLAVVLGSLAAGYVAWSMIYRLRQVGNRGVFGDTVSTSPEQSGALAAPAKTQPLVSPMKLIYLSLPRTAWTWLCRAGLMLLCSIAAYFVGAVGLVLVLSPLVVSYSGLELVGLSEIGAVAGGPALVVLVNAWLLHVFGVPPHLDKWLKTFMRVELILIVSMIALFYILKGLSLLSTWAFK
jgi:hypothetical protein